MACVVCEGGPYRDYDPRCNHKNRDDVEPTKVMFGYSDNGKRFWRAVYQGPGVNIAKDASNKREAIEACVAATIDLFRRNLAKGG